MSYLGSCHCGTVTFTVNAEIPSQAISCNCSICRRTGSLLTFVPADQFELNSGNDQLKTYEFNKHKIQHQFCQRCGIQSFSSGCCPMVPAAMPSICAVCLKQTWMRLSSSILTGHPLNIVCRC